MADSATLHAYCQHCHGPVTVEYEPADTPAVRQDWACPRCRRPNAIPLKGKLTSVLRRLYNAPER